MSCTNTNTANLNDDDSSNDNGNNKSDDDTPKITSIQKSHCTTVCMVPPSPTSDDDDDDDNEAWDALTRARKELRDPGFYRWPPHANLLYPFLQLPTSKKDSSSSVIINQDVIDALRRAAIRSKPFIVTLQKLGTFGGKHRGVLWMYPHSSYDNSSSSSSSPPNDNENDDSTDDPPFCDPSEPLIQLQSYLYDEFPFCNDQQKNGNRFHPHMTLSHFENLDDAVQAQGQIESWWTTKKTFRVKEIYVLQRIGDDGQFQIVATVPLGGGVVEEDDDTTTTTTTTTNVIQIHHPPKRFPAMPEAEEAWVYEERMKLKERRNKSGWRGRRGGGRRRRRGRSWNKERKVDTPEEIEAKRAARKAKREALELQKQQQQQQQQQEEQN